MFAQAMSGSCERDMKNHTFLSLIRQALGNRKPLKAVLSFGSNLSSMYTLSQKCTFRPLHKQDNFLPSLILTQTKITDRYIFIFTTKLETKDREPMTDLTVPTPIITHYHTLMRPGQCLPFIKLKSLPYTWFRSCTPILGEGEAFPGA